MDRCRHKRFPPQDCSVMDPPKFEEEDHNSTLYCSYIKLTYQCGRGDNC